MPPLMSRRLPGILLAAAAISGALCPFSPAGQAPGAANGKGFFAVLNQRQSINTPGRMRTITGKAYFGSHPLEQHQTEGRNYKFIFPVYRTFRYATRPESAAVSVLLRGPTSRERQQGYYSELDGYRLVSERFDDRRHRAVIWLHALGESSTDLFGVRGARFEDQLVRTLSQFGRIRAVRIYINRNLRHPREL